MQTYARMLDLLNLLARTHPRSHTLDSFSNLKKPIKLNQIGNFSSCNFGYFFLSSLCSRKTVSSGTIQIVQH